MDQRDTALSFDQQHFLYTLQVGRQHARIMHVMKTSDGWESPRTATFSGKWRDLEATFRPDNLELYFVSNRPLPGESTADDFNIWSTAWNGEGWNTPVPVDDLNTDGNEFYPSLTTEGVMYYTSEQEGGAGGEDIWFALPTSDGNGFQAPSPLGAGVNTTGPEFNAAIDPSGRYLIFGSARADGPGGGDMYISKRQDSGEWGSAALLGESINSTRLDFCPFFFGTDGDLFFSSNRESLAWQETSAPQDLSELREAWSAAGNSLGDLYRVKLQLPE